MASYEENDCEDELPPPRLDRDTDVFVSFKSCANVAISCKFIDTAVPVARHALAAHTRAQVYFDQIATVARTKQVHVEGVDSLLSIGQLAALLRFKPVSLDMRGSRSVAGLLCFEESTPRSSLCLSSPVYRTCSIETVSLEFAAALNVETHIHPRFRSGPVLAPLFEFIKTFYPRGCVMCIYHLSALLVKTTLCYDMLCMKDPAEYTERESLASDVLCDIVCGHAFSNRGSNKKHRLLHLYQIAMLLEPRFITTCVTYSEAIDAKLSLKMHKTKVALDVEHVNEHKCLHDAISSYMKYDISKIVPWVCVTTHIAIYVFNVLGVDIVSSFINPPKHNSTAHCLLTEIGTGRVIYHL